METYALAVPREQIAAFCLHHRVRKLSLFGSVLTSRFSPVSDIDVLVEFEASHVPAYFELAGMELSRVLGRKADLRTPQELSPYFRDEVLAAAAVEYVRE